jgi:glutamine amidotransferase-like uncharacterized protein
MRPPQMLNEMRAVRWSSVLLALSLVLLLASGCQNQGQPAGGTRAQVALYSDRGVWPQSVNAAEKMFQWIGHTTERIDAQDVKNGVLDNFRLLCVPGGNMYSYAEELSSTGVENIKSFVRHGGGYIGICGGAYFAAEKVVWQGNQLPMRSLEFFPGTAQGPFDEIAPYPDSTMCLVNMVDTEHAITKSIPDSAWILYYWGPALMPEADADVDTLGKYDIIGEPAIIALEYGSGRVFLIGTHPEIEEDSDRDGVTECDELDDRGSDWGLTNKATSWCLRE